MSTAQAGILTSSCHAKSKLYCGPYGPTASIFYGIWIKQSVAMVFIFNLDKLSLKKLFPTMKVLRGSKRMKKFYEDENRYIQF